MELFAADTARNRTRATLLLTDGCPNVQPPRGHVPMMKLFAEKHGGALPCAVSTFGFGYSLESDLLSEIAVEGSGSYAFIPDASFVGTVFVHALANVLTTCARSVTLSVEHDDAVLALDKSNGVLGGYRFDSVSWGTRVSVGTLNLGQPKVLVLKMFRKSGVLARGAPLGVTVTASYVPCNAPTADPLTLTVSVWAGVGRGGGFELPCWYLSRGCPGRPLTFGHPSPVPRPPSPPSRACSLCYLCYLCRRVTCP
jgi:hypothetical protein